MKNSEHEFLKSRNLETLNVINQSGQEQVQNKTPYTRFDQFITALSYNCFTCSDLISPVTAFVLEF